MIKIILTAFVITSMVTFVTWQNIKGVELDNSIGELKKEIESISGENNKVLIEIEKLKDINRLKKIGKDNLGLNSTENTNYTMMGPKTKEELIKFLSERWNIKTNDIKTQTP